ncbi:MULTISPECIES: hypothetical protein [Leptospira]|uniref:Uncharacterized protein n=2 Tax=Leptospira interrogans serovar Pyrogenes TaxID=280500 RepID=M6ZQS5_LEPIR|nr:MULTISPECIES: hypothetical protein [Leptospira]EMN30367.1 hypothetical protein LEP1GSC083_2590 [Leptospira interrogans serovar Pyrogenes str. L0374]EMP06547.1 hypothetical protein LEP1GSC124_5383 [Leptospira interrogans serovar Pyrogenes str. 200701872]EKO04626.1 hypothetical protein LEP1GSC077_3832 [Leptospira interrogans str. C10069]EMN61350.1 hypothetical protein LEP1GSC092_3543 [Leptospira interrogans serovar Pyrogenes str. R168]EMO82476.1 hypothetical protein LEP1GSC126_1712 [Leptospir
MLDNSELEMVLRRIEETLDVLAHNILSSNGVPKNIIIRAATEEILDIIQTH